MKTRNCQERITAASYPTAATAPAADTGVPDQAVSASGSPR